MSRVVHTVAHGTPVPYACLGWLMPDSAPSVKLLVAGSIRNAFEAAPRLGILSLSESYVPWLDFLCHNRPMQYLVNG